ncbi:MAG: DMT family transporter [Spirochaetota bacterium]
MALVYAQLLFAMLFFGLSFVFTAVSLQQLSPVTIILFRLMVSIMCLAAVGSVPRLRRITGHLVMPARSDIPSFLLIALFQPFLYFLGENTGLLYTTPAAASVVIATIPVLTPVGVFFVLRERVSWYTVLGAIVSLAGVGLLVRSDLGAGGNDIRGILFVFLAVLAAVGYSISLKRLPDHYSSVTVVVWQNIFGLLYFLPVFIIREQGSFPGFAGVSPEIWGAILFLGVFPSTVSFVFLSRGIRILGAAKANITTNTVPVFAALFSILVLGEPVLLSTIVGMVVVLTGVLISQVSNLAGWSSGGRATAIRWPVDT